VTRKRIPYSAAELRWLEKNRMMVISDYHRDFINRFERDDVKMAHLNALRKRKGWKVGRDGSRYKGRRRKYTKAEVKWLAKNCTLPISEYTAAFRAKFPSTEVTEQKLNAYRKNNGLKTGRTGCFPKGSVPANKGKKMPFNAASARTQFKKGQPSHNTRPLGHEYVSKKDGYTYICVDEVNPHTGFEHRFVPKHKWLWVKKNGPLPPHHVLKCLDGNRLNTDPANWEAVPQALLPRLAGRHAVAYDTAPAELKPTLMALAKLKHLARRKGGRRKTKDAQT